MGLLGEDTAIDPASKEKAAKSPLVPAEPEHLMQRVSLGDRVAFDKLHQRNILRISGYFRQRQPSSEVEDLSQEVFSRVWDNRHKYRNGTTDYAWLMGFACRILMEQQARVRSRSKVNPDVALDSIIDTSQASPQAQAETSERNQVLRALMVNLPERQRQAIELVYLNGLSCQEVSRKLDCSERTIGKYCQKGVMKLQAWMKGKE